MQKILLAYVCFAVSALAVPVCSDLAENQPACLNPVEFVTRLTETINANRSLPLSGVLAALKLPQGIVLGAQISDSLQRSDHRDNPRLTIVTKCGPLTFNLYARTLELAISKQIAESPVSSDGAYSAKAGEILIHYDQFPRDRAFTVPEVLNHLNPRYVTAPPNSFANDRKLRRTVEGQLVSHDTHACSRCHLDAGTKTSFGQTRWQLGSEFVDAIVSKYGNPPGRKLRESTRYCERDLQALFDCRCGKQTAACQKFLENGVLPRRGTEKEKEACARLGVVLSLKPIPHCDFYPEGYCA